MQVKNPGELRRIVPLLEEVLSVLDEQGLPVAGAHLDRCLDEVRRTLSLLQNGGT